MTYQELLLSEAWKIKRSEILKQDSNKCCDCHNEEYQKNFKRGLIIGNSISHKSPKNSIVNNKYLVHIWDIENNIIETAFIGLESLFIPENSYITYYDKVRDYANVYALKAIDNSKIELGNSIVEILKLGVKGRFTELTNQLLISPIAKSDNWKFVKGLHVHHTYYQSGLLPWEYPANSLITLCWSCHEKRHRNSTIPIHNDSGIADGKLTYCYRCYGAGIFPEYKHVQSGICFRCQGARYEELIE